MVTSEKRTHARTRRRMLRGIALVLTGVVVMTGCASEPAPTGDALYADGEQTYMSYREFTNGLQSVLSTGPWIVGQIGSYGMQPDRCNNDNKNYQYHLSRTLRLERSERDESAEAIIQYLEDAGMTPSAGTLGEGEGSLLQIMVRDEGDFSQLLVKFYGDGRVIVSADTLCRPGDAFALSDMLFGDELFLGDYLPSDTEAPTDPLFFGITPGDPQFVTSTPNPTETPVP